MKKGKKKKNHHLRLPNYLTEGILAVKRPLIIREIE